MAALAFVLIVLSCLGCCVGEGVSDVLGEVLCGADVSVATMSF